jgi:Family of unknown function (DUF6445)
MRTNLIIIDDFYTSPDTVRSYALQQEYSVRGNFPGSRSKPYLSEDIKSAINHIMQFAGGVTDWLEDSGYTGAFQIATANDRTWIHSDYNNMWAGVCYLTPDAPHTGGTGLFRHKATGEYERVTEDREGYDYTKYDLFDRIGNKYNRLIIYRGNLYHASLDYFGKDLNDGRLFQTFFFNTAHYG